jgi:WD40-like Beta Propeller Repeat
VLMLALAGGTAAAAASSPAGPRLAAVAFHPYPNAGSEVTSFAPDGSGRFRIAGGPDAKGPSPTWGTRPSWSADGSRVAFLGIRDGAPGTVFTVAADGSDPKVVPLSRGLLIEGDPVLAPDGRSIAVMRIDVISGHFERPFRRGRASDDETGVKVRTAIWSLGVDSSEMRPLTAWSRRVVLQPSSFSADGSHLAATEWDGGPTGRAISVDLETQRTKVLVPNAAEPVYAPDGSIAMLRDRFGPNRGRLEERNLKFSTLLVLAPGHVRPQSVVRVRGGLRWLSWDPSGQRIAFTRLKRTPPRGMLFPRPNSIAEVNADGSCLTTVAELARGFFFGSAWQPGLGREAGRISC